MVDGGEHRDSLNAVISTMQTAKEAGSVVWEWRPDPRAYFRAASAAVAALALLGSSACTITGPSLLDIAKLTYACIPEGTEIDTPSGPRRIEDLRAGDSVIGYSGKPVRVLQIHGYLENPHPKRFHRVAFTNGSVVELCDQHRIAGTRALQIEVGDTIGGVSVQSNETYAGVSRSYDLLTEDEGYRIQGIPVNSMIEELVGTAQRGQNDWRR